KGVERIRKDVVAGWLERADPHDGERRGARGGRTHDSAAEHVDQRQDDRRADDAVRVEDGERRTEHPVESGVKVRRRRTVDVPHIRVEPLAAREPERLVHFTAAVDHGVGPALPREREPYGERRCEDGEPPAVVPGHGVSLESYGRLSAARACGKLRTCRPTSIICISFRSTSSPPRGTSWRKARGKTRPPFARSSSRRSRRGR